MRTVVLTGAGASRPLGLPLMTDFVQAEWRSQLEQQSADNIPIYDIAMNWATLPDTGVTDFELLYTAVHEFSTMNPSDFAALPFARHREDRGLAYRSRGNAVIMDFIKTKQQASLLVQALRRFVHERLGRVNSSDASDLYGPFFRLLLSAVPQLDLFTTNYDQSVEAIWADDLAAVMPRAHLADGFSELNPQRGRELSPATYAKSASEAPTIRLYKLHGSLYWSSIAGHVVKTPNPIYLGNNVLIYPLRGKHPLEEPFASLLALFSEALHQATTLLVVGHSLRDQHIVDAIGTGLRTNPSLHLFLCDVHPDGPLGQIPSDLRDRCTPIPRAFGSSELLTELRSAFAARTLSKAVA